VEQLIRVLHGRHDVVDVTPDPIGYTYSAYETEPLSIGDVVEVPGSWHRPSLGEATVVGIGSDFEGAIVPIVRVIERKEP